MSDKMSEEHGIHPIAIAGCDAMWRAQKATSEASNGLSAGPDSAIHLFSWATIPSPCSGAAMIVEWKDQSPPLVLPSFASLIGALATLPKSVRGEIVKQLSAWDECESTEPPSDAPREAE